MVRKKKIEVRLPIDKEYKVTAKWGFKETGLVTRLITRRLNLDFAVNRTLSRIGIRLSGLSMLVVGRKVE